MTPSGSSAAEIYNSVLVEFQRFPSCTVVAAPLGEARSLAVIAEVNRLVPKQNRSGTWSIRTTIWITPAVSALIFRKARPS